MAWLTKSRFMSGRQCPKRLWFEVNEPLEEKPLDSLPLINGRKFDDLVRTLQPGTVISRERGMPAAIAETTRVMGAGSTAVLYQPAFRFGDLAVIADVLRREQHEFSLMEVKASTQVKDIHIPDAAFQALVLRGVRIPVTRVFVGHVDRQFVLERTGDYEGLLVEEDVTERVAAIVAEVADNAKALQAVMAASEVPAIAMGPQCSDPYECPFIPRCSKARGAVPDYPVDLLPRRRSRWATSATSRRWSIGWRRLSFVKPVGAAPFGNMTSRPNHRQRKAGAAGFDRDHHLDL